jgi:hypothetical protein
MKIQIDTEAKIIKLEQSAKITEVLSVIKKLLPNDWKEYSLEAVTIINNWTNPVIIDRWPYYQPFYVGQPFTISADSLTVTSNECDVTTSAYCSSVTNYQITTN